MNQTGSAAIPALLTTIVWLGCLAWTAPRIEAYLHGQVETAVAISPQARVETRGRRVILRGVDTANGDAALLAKRIRGVPCIGRVIIDDKVWDA